MQFRWRLLIPSFFATVILGACVEPVIRRNQETEDPIQTRSDYDKSDLKKRVWIVPFDQAIAWNETHGNDPKIAQSLHKAMSKTFDDPKGPMTVVNPFSVGLEDTQVTSSSDEALLKSTAQLAGADGFLKGTIVSAEVLRTQLPDGLVKTNEFRVVLRASYELHDAFSGRLLYRGQEEEVHLEQRSDVLRIETKYPEVERRLQQMAVRLSQKIYNAILPATSRMGWTGRVINIENARVYLNSGERTGIRMGDVLKVIEPFKSIADDQSGKFIGNVPGRIKGTIKVIQFFGNDGSIGILQSGGGFRPGDMIQLY